MPSSSNSFRCRWEHILVVSMVIYHLFQEVLTHRAEGVDKNTCLLADTAVRQVRSHIIAIASPENLFFVTDGHFKAAAGHVGTLGVGMLMKGSDGSLLELHFYHHQVLVVAHNLAYYALTGILPLDVGGYLVGIACLFHKSNLMFRLQK